MKAFIFDMDGVIIDSEPIHFEIDVQTLKHLGLDVSPHELEEFVGMTNPEMWEILKQRHQLPQTIAEIIAFQLSSKIAHLNALDIEPIDGIREWIAELKRLNVPIAIASSSPVIFINGVLEKFQLKAHFDCIVSGEEVAKGKPEPDVYLEAAAQLGVQPGDCVVLEDSRNGVKAAKAAGMKCIGIINENSGNQDLSQADLIVKSVRELSVEALKQQ
ncbi:HAD family phosphatase [Paenibacillus sp. NEAU-GSW1]|uniref:HAD family hydrolase n=1 Tax=Paenibacillus sp. NEAU-GSW1 TaxID=2682486 RepID=UPI0012E1A6B8|nr:HAD family phosphatase [Paenibacillus sp. NEAU-GSW1]MUT65193.1 HAD-IA family hydrolase [Paenibacillus sp. NEAU-GSW1]